MNIDPKDKIAEFPILDVRKLMSQAGDYLDEEFVARRLKTSTIKARKLIRDLENQGYVEKKFENARGTYWEITMKGRALVLSSAAKPISRGTAEKKLVEFLERVVKVRDNDYYLYKVKRVFVFGSFLGKKEQISDLDLAIELVAKSFPGESFEELINQRIHEAHQNGKQFSNIVERVTWPQQEVWKYLKARSRSLSLHPYLKEMEKHSKHKLIYKD